MIAFDMAERVAVVTGGASGIGAAIVDRLLRSGARVAVWDMAATPGADGDNRIEQPVDVTSASGTIEAAAEVKRRWVKIDILINCAGIAGPIKPSWSYPIDAWRAVQRVNVEGTLLCCQAVVPGMIERDYGRIVNIASIAGKEGNPNASAYSASKAAVIALTKSMGKELATNDIAVNCVTPATADTPILDQVSPEFIEYMRGKIPRGRFVSVAEIASMVCWLASTENAFATGAVFDISGGRATY